jgi:hypothetical protein
MRSLAGPDARGTLRAHSLARARWAAAAVPPCRRVAVHTSRRRAAPALAAPRACASRLRLAPAPRACASRLRLAPAPRGHHLSPRSPPTPACPLFPVRPALRRARGTHSCGTWCRPRRRAHGPCRPSCCCCCRRLLTTKPYPRSAWLLLLSCWCCSGAARRCCCCCRCGCCGCGCQGCCVGVGVGVGGEVERGRMLLPKKNRVLVYSHIFKGTCRATRARAQGRM